MSSICEFYFDNPDRLYLSGDLVNVAVYLTTTKLKDITGIYIRFLGLGRVHWLLKDVSKYYEEGRTFLNCQRMVHQARTLTAGKRVFKYSIWLPSSVPSSCHTKYGSVFYTCQLIIKRPREYDNEFVQTFTVVRPLKYLNILDISFPIHEEQKQIISSWRNPLGKLKVAIQLATNFYATKDMIRIDINVTNKTHLHIAYKIKVDLLQYFEHGENTKKIRYLTESACSKLLEMTCDARQTSRLPVGFTLPALPPTIPQGLIRIAYALNLIMNNQGESSNVCFRIPLVIGTNDRSAWRPADAAVQRASNLNGQRL